jgi:Flp pilus assembly protein TadB
MVMVGLLAAGVVIMLLAALMWSMRIGRRRSQAQECVTEEEARGNAAPLTTAILSESRDRERSSARERHVVSDQDDSRRSSGG